MNGYIPNSFQTPNLIVDRLMVLLTGNELKILLFTIRHIYGWIDKVESGRAPISLSMYEDGYGDFQGVGLSKPTISKILKELVKYKVLIKDGQPTSKGQVWGIGIDPDINALTDRENKRQNKAKPKMKLARASRQTEPEVVKPISPLNEDESYEEVVKPINQQVVKPINQQVVKPINPIKHTIKTQTKTQEEKDLCLAQIRVRVLLTRKLIKTLISILEKDSPKGKTKDPMYDAIVEAYQAHGGLNGLIKILLTGQRTEATSRNEIWYGNRLSVPVEDAEEIKQWGAWYKKHYRGMSPLRDPVKINSEFCRFRADGQKPTKYTEEYYQQGSYEAYKAKNNKYTEEYYQQGSYENYLKQRNGELS